MGTFKRAPFEIDTTVRNGSKFLNQMQFNGIVQNNNTYDVDQNSLTDALNVYVNEQNTLVSREPLIKDTIEIDYPSETAQLIDIKECNGVKVFVFKDGEKYTIVAAKNGNKSRISNINNYHITIFDQYIICWNDTGAVAINTNKTVEWQLLENFIEPPVTKTIAGGSITKFDKNEFSESYKEQYIRDNKTETLLPIDDSAEITGEIVTNGDTYQLSNLELTNTHLRYQILKPLNVPISQESQVSLAVTESGLKMIAVASNEYVYISYDGGSTFIAIALPDGRHGGYRVKSLTEDGRGLFYLDPFDGAYYLNLSSLQWELYQINQDSSDTDKNPIAGTITGYHFLNSENFCFTTRDEYSQIRVYYKGLNMNYNDKINEFMSYNSEQNIYSTYQLGDNYLPRMCKIAVDSIAQRAVVLLWLKRTDSDNGSLLSFVGRPKTQEADTAYGLIEKSDIGYRTIEKMSFKDSVVTMTGISYKTSNQNYYEYETTITVGDMSCSITSDKSEYLTNCPMFEPEGSEIYWTFPFVIDGRIYQDGGGRPLVDYETNTTIKFPDVDDKSISTYYPRPKLATNGKGYFILYSTSEKIDGPEDYANTYVDWIFTNIYADTDKIIITYTYNSDTKYVKVPTLTYSSSELFLAFDNTLMITKNIKDGSDILFNLPKVYSQSFANTIKAIINISTTELAIFFENGITICSKVTDDLLGYNYNLAKTRLTLGTKFGDSVINTADGASTLYATPRGLAIMNYQAYMATTDQTLQFISDKIYAIWNKFYLSSENISLVQHGDYVFVYNTSNQYLMLDLRNYSWWKLEIPFNIKKIITDQIDLRIISDKLYKFKRVNNNTSKIEDDYVDNQYYDVDNEPIRWMFMSQRLHFNLPNHYKNMKQLVFHLVQSTGHISTFNAQIKLYRNSVNYKDMEVIPFDFNFAVDEFRTFVKRFNYWKINMLQYGVANDDKAAVPARLVCNGIDIKYEIGDEVR